MPSSNSALITMSADGKRLADVEQSSTQNLMRVAFPPGQPAGARRRRSPRARDSSPSRRSRQTGSGWPSTPSTRATTSMLSAPTAPESRRYYRRRVQEHRTAVVARWEPDCLLLQSQRPVPGVVDSPGRQRPAPSDLTAPPTRRSTTRCGRPMAGTCSTARSTSTRSSSIRLRAGMSRPPKPLPPLPDKGMTFAAWSWSSDGRRLAGWRLRADGVHAGVTLTTISPRSGTTTLTETGRYPTCLPTIGVWCSSAMAGCSSSTAIPRPSSPCHRLRATARPSTYFAPQQVALLRAEPPGGRHLMIRARGVEVRDPPPFTSPAAAQPWRFVIIGGGRLNQVVTLHARVLRRAPRPAFTLSAQQPLPAPPSSSSRPGRRGARPAGRHDPARPTTCCEAADLVERVAMCDPVPLDTRYAGHIIPRRSTWAATSRSGRHG